jgi:UDP-N-acetyl-2-amino-2-deoxyglucuronate dehydrogenase
MPEIRFSIIGAGNIGKVHAQAIAALPGARLTLVCDRNPERAQAIAEPTGARWTDDCEAAAADPQVDVVCVCTPSGNHAEIAETAAAAGKHLAVEKPIEVTLERADRITRAAAQAGVKLTCIFPSRFRMGPQKVKAAMQAGRLGQLVLADAYVKWYRTQAYYRSSWRGTWALDGGGALMNQSIHTIDLLQWLAGPAERIFGQWRTLAHSIEAEDVASAVVSFRSGALGVIQGSTSCWPGEPARLELHGDAGTIVLEEGCIVRWQLADATAGEEEEMLNLEQRLGNVSSDPMGMSYELHRRQLADLVEAIRDDRPPAIPGSEARKSVEIILAIYRSAQCGAPVDIEDQAER